MKKVIGIYKKHMRTIILKNELLWGGWGNGYVLIPPGHPLYGLSYLNINNIDVHGGLTFSEFVTDEMIETHQELLESDKGMWMIGFDTLHAWDSQSSCPKKYVKREADRLLAQLTKYK